ncbi:MAG: hypothetical protein ACRDHP_17320 [Ktedonobacterales bacterium]
MKEHINSRPNRRDDPRSIVGLVRRVLTVSVETVRLAGAVALPLPEEVAAPVAAD